MMGLAVGLKLAILAAAAACGLASAATTTEKRVDSIVGKHCATCHGPTGQSSNSQFPKLTGQNIDYLVRQLFNFKTRARKSSVMEAQVANLSGNDIELLANYFSSQRLIPDATPDLALAEAGRSVYMQGNPASGITACAVCHGPRARGGQLLPRLAGQHAEYIETQLRRYIELSRTTDQTLMHSVASKMTNAEIHSVSYFLSGFD